MIEVSDTSPLCYLAMIGGMEWLPALIGEVICPPEVIEECRHPCAPEELRAWASNPPSWVRIDVVADGNRELPIEVRLDAGERAALGLAREVQADLVLLDERRGRAVAAQLGIAVTGTLGVLVEAAFRGHVDLEEALQKLTTCTNFRTSDAVIAAARNRLFQRRSLDGIPGDFPL